MKMTTDFITNLAQFPLIVSYLMKISRLSVILCMELLTYLYILPTSTSHYV